MDLNTSSSPLPFPRFTMPRAAYDTTGVLRNGLPQDAQAIYTPPHHKKVWWSYHPTLPHNEAPLREEAPNEHPQPPQQNVTKKA